MGMCLGASFITAMEFVELFTDLGVLFLAKCRGFKQKQQSHKVQKQLSEFNRCQTVTSERNPLTIMHIHLKYTKKTM